MRLREGLVEHAHSDAHIVCWLSGSPAVARVTGRVLQYDETTATATNPYEPHDFKLIDPARPAVMLAIYISRAWLDQRRRETGNPYVFASPELPIDSRLRAIARRATSVLLGHDGDASSIDQEFCELISSAMEASSQNLNARTADATSLIDFRLRRALVYMRDNARERIGLSEVASQVGLSRAHFFTLFRNQLHMTPQIFWSTVRMEEAIEALVYDDESLTNVAIDLGFSASSNFSRFFKEHTGASPTEYRRARTVSPAAHVARAAHKQIKR